MASKVLVKIPAVNFNSTTQSQQVVPKKGSESVALGRADGSGTAVLLPSMSADPLLRITQLEQNIRFLHEQHQLMLSGLHQEIETLRRRNRDLQFQLVFTKKNAVYGGQQTSSESSPDDDGKTKTLAASPNQMCNTQNLQVEMLEKDISDLRTTLNELSEKNNNLSKTLDEQAERLDKALSIEGEYEARLEDANKLIKRLRRENDDQRREMNILRTQLNNKGSIPSTSPSSSAGAGGRHGSGGSRRGGPGSGGPSGRGDKDRDSSRDHNVNQRDNSSQQHHRFPPLHTQQYWQRSRQQSNDCGPGGQNSGNNSENSPMLPHLQLRHHHFNNQHPQNKGNHHNGSGRYYNGNHSGGHHHYYNNNHRGNRSGGGSSGREGGGGNGGGGNRGGSGNQKQQQQHQQQESQ